MLKIPANKNANPVQITTDNPANPGFQSNMKEKINPNIPTTNKLPQSNTL